MSHGARGYLWLRHELRRKFRQRMEGRRRQVWFLIGAGVAGVFAAVVTILALAGNG